MLLKLRSEDVAHYWNELAPGILESLPVVEGNSQARLNNILTGILVGETECWLSYKLEDGQPSWTGICLTKLIYDDYLEVHSLLLYCVCSYFGFSDQEWIEAFDAMSKYALSRGAKRIVAYSRNPEIIKRAEQFGGDSETRFISFKCR